MKLNHLLLLSVGIMIPSITFSTEYYLRPGEAVTNNKGTSWDDAISIEEFYETFTTGGVFQNGDIFYFAGGTYYPCQTGDGDTPEINQPFTFIGGFDPASTGKVTALPSYPSITPTLFSGDLNKNGKPDTGDACHLINVRIKSHNEENTFTIQGIDFTCSYGRAENYNAGALFGRQSRLVIKNCNIYNNESRDYGGAGVMMHGCQCHLLDCTLTGNKAQESGAAFRVSTNSSSKGYAVIERCLITGNEIAGKFGGGVAFSSGTHCWLVNSTIVNNKAMYEGGGFVANASKIAEDDIRRTFIISSTIAGNECFGDPEENEGSIDGSQIRFAQPPYAKILNSIIIGKSDDGTLANSSMTLTGTEKNADDENYVFLSGGYNVLGSFTTTAENPTYQFNWDNDNMSSSNTYEKVFGNNVLANNGGPSMTLAPKDGFNTALDLTLAFGSDIQQIVETWNETMAFPMDFTVDQTGAKRADKGETAPGAYDHLVAYNNVKDNIVIDGSDLHEMQNIAPGIYQIAGLDLNGTIKIFNMHSGLVKTISEGNIIDLTELPTGVYIAETNAGIFKMIK